MACGSVGGGVNFQPAEQEADVKTVLGLYNEGCTMQLHQPQRFNPHLWQLIAGLETELGCLVGSNAYLTPAGLISLSLPSEC